MRELDQGVGEAGFVLPPHQASGDPILHLLRHAAHRGRDHGQTLGHGFERGVRATGGLRHQGEHIESPQEAAHVLGLAHELDGEVGGKRSKFGDVIGKARLRAAGDLQDIGRESRMSEAQSAEEAIDMLSRIQPRRGADGEQRAEGTLEPRVLLHGHAVWNDMHGRAQRLFRASALPRVFHHHPGESPPVLEGRAVGQAGAGIREVALERLEAHFPGAHIEERDVEQRIAQAGQKGELQGWRPTLDKPDIPRPPDGIPQNIADHMRLMCDILVLGFQTDTTRITTLKLNNDHSSLRFPNLGVDYMIHHLLSHSDTADWLKVNQFFLEQVAYIARKLDAIQEGPRTALDNTMLMYCSSMLTGNHDATQLPVVLLGGGGGRLKGGRVLDYKEKSERQMCRLYLSMMDKMSVRLPKFGDATKALEEA